MADDIWRHDLPAPVLAQIKELASNHPWRHLKILALLGCWFAAGGVAVLSDSLLVDVPCWILIGFSLHGLGIFMHEGAHHNLLGRRWPDRVVGFLSGLPVLFSCSCYRATHKLHHVYENSARDPDSLHAALLHNGLLRVVVAGFLLVGTPLYSLSVMLTGPFRADSWGERLACIAEVLLLGTIVASAVAVAPRDLLVDGWLMGVLFAIPIANFRALAEHTLLPTRPYAVESPFATRSLPASVWVNFFFNNQNYHLEHHLFPNLPWYSLPKVHVLLREFYEQRHAHIGSYRDFARQLAWFVFTGKSNAAVQAS